MVGRKLVLALGVLLVLPIVSVDAKVNKPSDNADMGEDEASVNLSETDKMAKRAYLSPALQTLLHRVLKTKESATEDAERELEPRAWFTKMQEKEEEKEENKEKDNVFDEPAARAAGKPKSGKKKKRTKKKAGGGRRKKNRGKGKGKGRRSRGKGEFEIRALQR